MADLTDPVMKVRELLHILRLRESIVWTEARLLDVQQCNVLGRLRSLRSKMPACQARVVEDVKDIFYVFYQCLAALLSDFVAAPRLGISVALTGPRSSL